MELLVETLQTAGHRRSKQRLKIRETSTEIGWTNVPASQRDSKEKNSPKSAGGQAAFCKPPGISEGASRRGLALPPVLEPGAWRIVRFLPPAVYVFLVETGE